MSKIKKELKRFLVAGLSAVGTDLVTYYMLLNFLPHDIAKAISFLLGTVVAFIINKYWTFEKYERSYKEILKFALLYSVTLGANVVTNNLFLEYTSLVFVAFLVATGVSTVLNFIGQKWWVFR
ncbi:GtrA family protein [Poseidonibacter ostreae]|uniref:GtrA family protein n=1 Tax=Poseidonibacter ostreae TaxID=2654171 RepID=A0ABQ6VPM3_9BACT|nr:GtrA family protein [Poseidonibacter ostreae]KAB7892657.1 GtrA family protein [Poseidonibacter ostreae]